MFERHAVPTHERTCTRYEMHAPNRCGQTGRMRMAECDGSPCRSRSMDTSDHESQGHPFGVSQDRL